MYVIIIFFSLDFIFQTLPNTSQSLVRDAEQVAKLLSNTLINDTEEMIIPNTNIGKVFYTMGFFYIHIT